MEEVRWGIIGVGDVCEIKSGPAFYKCDGSKLVAVMRRTGEKARDFARRHNVPAAYDKVEDLLADPNVNALYVATPPGSHLEIAMKCLERGLPTYMEKPVARNAVETRKIVEAFEARGIPLFVAYYRRGQPKFHKARDIVQSGTIGDVTSVSYRLLKPSFQLEPEATLPWRFRAPSSGGGLVMDVGCHTIDIIDFIVGPITQITGSAYHTAAPYAVEDNVALSGKLVESGALISMQWAFACAPGIHDDTITIRGTKGDLTFSTFGFEPMQLRTLLENESGEAKGEPAYETQALEFPKPQHAHQPLVQLIVNELRGGAESPSKGDNGIRVAQILDTVLSSYYGGRDDAFWDREEQWGGGALVR